MKKKILRSIIAIALACVLGVGGFFLGYQYKEKVPMKDPIITNTITFNVENVNANLCMNMFKENLIYERLVENLMLLCTVEDLKESIEVTSVNKNQFKVIVPMEKEDNMIYFSEELSYILNEEVNKVHKDAKISISDEKEEKINFERKNSIKAAIAVCTLGILLGAGVSVAAFKLWDKKKKV